MQTEVKVVIALLKAAIEQKPFRVEETEIEWEKVEEILNAHKIMNMTYYGYRQMENKEYVPKKLVEKMQKADELATAKEAHQHFGLEELREKFEKEEIDFLPLKGSILKYFYPFPQMRLMSDMDILYRIEQKEEMHRCLCEMGFELEHPGVEDDAYKRKPFLYVEMHRRLIPKPKEMSQYFDRIWERVTLKEGKHAEYEMTWEDYYLYLVAHIAKHFSNAGTGLRSLADFHVFYHKKGKELDRTLVDKRLREMKMDQFEAFLIETDACVFGEKEWSDEQLQQTFDYMLGSGIYGKMAQYYANTAAQVKGVEKIPALGKIKNMLRMIFLKRDYMELLYPWLVGRSYLLVPAWIYRIFHRMIFRRKESAKQLSRTHVDEEELYRMQQIRKRAGLRG